MDDFDIATLIYLEDEQSSEDEKCRSEESDIFRRQSSEDKKRRSEESDIFRNRATDGLFKILVHRHLQCNEEKFKQYFRLTPVLFDYVLNHIKDELTSKPYNRHKKPISPEEKLCILVRYLAMGESFRSLALQCRVSHSWISVIVREVAEAIINKMFKLIIPSPTGDQLQKLSSKFFSKWNYPNCVGAISGKHIRITHKSSGSLYYNSKEYYSIVLLAVVDADCKFTAIDVGSYGKEGDGDIYLKSNIGNKIKNNSFNIPAPKALPGTDSIAPHVIIGDEAFALHENLMKPYPKRQTLHDPSKAVYNYRLSQARSATENTFGILCGYFRFFFLPIATAPETTDNLIICACILHNILREAKVLAPGQKHIDDALPLPTKNVIPITEHNIRARTDYTHIREIFKNYFNGPGAVEWQHNYAVQH